MRGITVDLARVVEQIVVSGKQTRSRVALAVTGDSQADITSWVEAKPARKRTLKICTAGVHGSAYPVTLYDARDLEKTVQDVLALK